MEWSSALSYTSGHSYWKGKGLRVALDYSRQLYFYFDRV